ncbi:flagellar basal body-associated FliL family protein [Roseiarcus sp.]|uniref:flagellar basal body-associated FliL family protein n=1 Tax=Roseiarcus sp. TaxID=1969460 RepID=UPI003F9D2155
MADAAAPAVAPSGGFKGALIEFLIVALIGASAGAGFEMLRPAVTEAQKPKEAAAPAEASTIYDLAPIVTNLGAPQDTWIRLEASIVFDPKALPHPEAVAGKIGEDVLAYLRTTTLKQLEGPIGLQSVREDLNERAATRSDGKVRELVLRTLVVQ